MLIEFIFSQHLKEERLQRASNEMPSDDELNHCLAGTSSVISHEMTMLETDSGVGSSAG